MDKNERAERERVANKNILTAAMHNLTVFQDQLSSMTNEDDDSFTDHDMSSVLKQAERLQQEMQAVLDKLERVNG